MEKLFMRLLKPELVQAQIGGSSLIGVSGKAPHGWGNYFWLSCGSRVLNMWAENLTAANIRFNLGNQVAILRYKSDDADYAFICDNRIPDDWYYDKLCYTGASRPPKEVLEEYFATVGGDIHNELEFYTDPVSYYDKRGWIYTPGSGILRGKPVVTQSIINIVEKQKKELES